MRGIYRFVILSLTSILFFQCQRELSNIGSGDQGQIVTPDPITSNLQGNVFDENGQPAQGVTIKVGAKSATTDNKGYFRINGAVLDKNQALVTAEKTGYFKAFRAFSATSGTNQVVIKLVKKNLGGTVNATSGGDVTLSNGTKISLAANSIVKASDNSAYTGTVNVYAAYIDPTSQDILQTVPGSFMANDKDGKRVILSSYGMMAVELEGASGEKLQIKSGNTAILTSPIPSSAQASAPTTIPLWYVDETTGLWKEEGTATKQGNNYVGTVKHFTYWNCDLPLQTVQFTATFQTSDGQPLVNSSIVIRPATGSYYGSAHGYTDSLGQVHGPIPANMNLILEVRDMCNNVIYSQNIGPYSQSVNLGTITVSSSTQGIITVKGKLLTCSNTNVVNGYAVVVLGNYVHYAAVDASGNFSTNYVVCSGSSASTVQVFGVDGTAQQQGTAASFPVTSPITNVGNISACGTSTSQFINYTYDGTSYTVTSPADSLVGFTQGMGGNVTSAPYSTSIMGSHNNNFISFRFISNTMAAGTYPLSNITINNATSANNPSVNVTVTNFPQTIGDFYEGSLTGTFTDSLATTTHTINATFKVRKNF